MSRYRITIRHGRPARYHIEDVEAPSLREALQLALERVPPEVGASADLLEIRGHIDPEAREFGPG